MKNSARVLKIISLVIPAVLLVYVLWLRNGTAGGDGSYDLAKFYVTAGVGIWAALFVLAMLIKKTRGQVWYLVAGGFLFGFSAMMVVKLL